MVILECASRPAWGQLDLLQYIMVGYQPLFSKVYRIAKLLSSCSVVTMKPMQRDAETDLPSWLHKDVPTVEKQSMCKQRMQF